MTPIFLPPAERELAEAVAYYNQERQGLGFEFASEVRRAVERIAASPTAWHPLSANTRRCRMHRFPYGVVYHHVGPETLVIVAVMHLRRHPDAWRGRGF